MEARPVPPALLEDVKNYLGETWPDQERDQRLTDMTASGMRYLDRILGEPADYESAGDPRTLLFDYVRYYRDGALDLFEGNYSHLLQEMQDERRLSAYAETAPDTPKR